MAYVDGEHCSQVGMALRYRKCNWPEPPGCEQEATGSWYCHGHALRMPGGSLDSMPHPFRLVHNYGITRTVGWD